MTSQNIIHELFTSFWGANLFLVFFLFFGTLLFSHKWHEKIFKPNSIRKIFGLSFLLNAAGAGVQAVVCAIMIAIKKYL